MGSSGFYFALFFFTACVNHAPPKAEAPNDPTSLPNTCRIEATVIRVLDPSSVDRNDVCHRFSCEAIVHLEKISRCGNAASITTDEQGYITLHFAYTLHPTGELFPTLIPSYPGLNNGNRFVASVDQQLRPGDSPRYIVYAYEVK